MIGRSTSGIISLGMALVAGRKRVPNPAAGRTALRTRAVIGLLLGVDCGAEHPRLPGCPGVRTTDAATPLFVAGGRPTISIDPVLGLGRGLPERGATIAPPMFKQLIRTFRGPSNDPRMAYISRPLPRDLPDEQVVAALELAFSRNPDPGYLVETLPEALKEVTGRDLQVLDRSVRDVTGAFTKTFVMIRDGDVGRWPGYDAMAYPLLAPSAKREETRAAIAAANSPDGEAEKPQGPKPGWAPPPPLARR
jgi:hypothetical protein